MAHATVTKDLVERTVGSALAPTTAGAMVFVLMVNAFALQVTVVKIALISPASTTVMTEAHASMGCAFVTQVTKVKTAAS